jgi:ParB/RepB/Spo0J family partition protein
MAREVKYIDPNALTIVGLDVDEEGSPLNDERATWDADENMVRNIMVFGIQQPVLVRYEAGTTYVIDGRQRVKCAREAVKRQDSAGEFATKVPCIEVKADDGRVRGIMISTNEIRQDDSVLGKARKAASLLDMVGNKEEVAAAFGRSTKTIDNWLKLLQADPKVHEAIEEGKISAHVGIELSGKSRQDQIQALDQILGGSPASSTPKPKSPASPSSPSSSSSSPKEHAGVKKGWLRKAMKTQTFQDLPQEERETLEWILLGTAPKDHWLDIFTYEADSEMDGL